MNVIEENKKYLNKYKPKVPQTIRVRNSFDCAIGKKNGGISFYNGTTNQAILYYNTKRMNCAILNFANSHYVGGGDLSCFTQEEELCKTIVNLYPSLKLCADEKHKYNNFQWWNRILYLSDMTLLREDSIQSNKTYNVLHAPIQVSVITAAAPNLHCVPSQIRLFLDNPKKIFDQLENVIATSCMTQIILNKQNNNKQNYLLLN